MHVNHAVPTASAMVRWISILLAFGSFAVAGSKLAPELEQRAQALGEHDSQATVEVIIQYRQVPTEAHHRKVRAQGGVHQRDLSLIKAGHYTVPASALEALANDPDVEFIHPDRVVRSTSYSGKLDYGWMTVTGLTFKDATLPYAGSGIGVAIIDSGMNDNREFDDASGKSRIVYQKSFVATDPNWAGDAFGHGDHVTGIVAARGSESTGSWFTYKIRGIAPNVNIINLRALDGSGAGTDSAVIAAIQTAISLKSTYNIRVMNLSLGRPVATSYVKDPLCQAVEQAWKAGIVVVVAAGNEGRNNSANTQGYATITAPGNDPYVITVGAMNTNGTLSRADDKLTSYSSKVPRCLTTSPSRIWLHPETRSLRAVPSPNIWTQPTPLIGCRPPPIPHSATIRTTFNSAGPVWPSRW